MLEAVDHPDGAREVLVEVTDQVPARARLSTRLRQLLLAAVVGSGRVVADVAAGHRVSWWTVQDVVNAAAERLVDPDDVTVRRLGVDEHRYRSVRFFRDTASGSWRRNEPWMTTFVDITTGRVLGVVDGRDSASVAAWLSARSTAWREQVEVVAIVPRPGAGRCPHRRRRSGRPCGSTCPGQRSVSARSIWSSSPTTP